eukprot:gene8855-61899_t
MAAAVHIPHRAELEAMRKKELADLASAMGMTEDEDDAIEGKPGY